MYPADLNDNDTINLKNRYLFQAPIEQYSIDELKKKYGNPDIDDVYTVKSDNHVEEEFGILISVKSPLYKEGNQLRDLIFKGKTDTILEFTYVLDSNIWLCGSFYSNVSFSQEDTLYQKPYLNYTFEDLVGILGTPIYDSIRDTVYLTNEVLPDFVQKKCGKVTNRLRRTAWHMGADYVLINFAECYDCIWKPYDYYIGDKIVYRNF